MRALWRGCLLGLLLTSAAVLDPRAARALPAAQFYVSPSGDDAHPGTMERPFRTLARAREQRFLSRAHPREGETALTVDADVLLARCRVRSVAPRAVSVWMYDDPAKRAALCMAVLRGPAAIEEGIVGLGVDGSISRDHYVVQEWGDRISHTSVKRTRGWHRLLFEFDPRDGCAISIDGLRAANVPSFRNFDTVDLGDPRFGSDSRGLGFDDFAVE